MIMIKSMFCSGIMFFFPFPQIFNQNSPSNPLSIPVSELKPDATYCVKVRSIPSHRDYTATWSEWSPLACWKTKAGEGEWTLSAQYSVDALIRRVCCLLFGAVVLFAFIKNIFVSVLENVSCALRAEWEWKSQINHFPLWILIAAFIELHWWVFAT